MDHFIGIVYYFMNILQEVLFNRQINGSTKGEIPNFVFKMNQEYKIVVSQTLVGDKVRMINSL